MKNYLVYPLLMLQSCFSKFSGPVDKEVSDSYYYGRSNGEIRFSPMGNWFELGNSRVDADKATFRPIARDFGKDKDYVFYRAEKLSFVDLESFVVEDEVIKDANKVYAESSYKIIVVEDADPGSFRYIHKDDLPPKKWAKDNHSYFLDHVKVDVDYGSFWLLKNGLVADKNFVYETIYPDSSDWSKVILEKKDTVQGEIKELNDLYFTINNCVYGYNSSFGFHKTYLEKVKDISIIDSHFIKVNEIIFIDGEKFPYEGVDFGSFRRVKGPNSDIYFQDKNHVYYQGKVINGVDLDTFSYLGGGYAKDRNFVYFLDLVVEGAHPTTFYFDEKKYEWRDGKTQYQQGRPFNRKS